MATRSKSAQPAAPPGLSVYARQLWKDAIESRPDAIWAPSDMHLLRMCVVAMADVERLSKDIEKAGEVVDGKLNPLCSVRAMRERTATQLATRLRLTPQARFDAKSAHRYAAQGAKAARTQATLDDDDDNLLAGSQLQ